MITELTFNVIKIFSLAAIASILAILWCPFLTNFLYKHKLWKTSARQKAISLVKGDWFMFVDSDVVLSRNWFAEAEKHGIYFNDQKMPDINDLV